MEIERENESEKRERERERERDRWRQGEREREREREITALHCISSITYNDSILRPRFTVEVALWGQ